MSFYDPWLTSGSSGVLVLQHEKFQSAPGSRVGTPAYLAPEVILTTKGKTYDGKVMLTLPFSPLLPSHTHSSPSQLTHFVHYRPTRLFVV